MNTPKARTPKRPPIIMAESEAERLYALASQQDSLGARLLIGEIERAKILRDEKVPPHIARMNSIVQFIDESHGARRAIRLVYPNQADIEAGWISVLTPVGAGLIGLGPEQQIRWPDRDGHERALRVIDVRPPEALMF